MTDKGVAMGSLVEESSSNKDAEVVAKKPNATSKKNLIMGALVVLCCVGFGCVCLKKIFKTIYAIVWYSKKLDL